MREETRQAPVGEGGAYAPRDATFLADVSRLLADSLDYEATLATVARLALPHLGAWCIVDVVEDEEIRRLAVVHPDPRKQELARQLREGWPPSRHDPLGVPAVARTRRSEVVPRVDAGLLARAARSEENLAILRELGIGSLMTVPLVARGDILGAITFVGPDRGHHYTGDDLALAEDLAARAAIAIDNARLYRMAERARETAELASQAKSQFLGTMSHELRTPINAVLGYAQLLDMGVKGSLSEEQRELLRRIEVSGKHLLDLVTRILDVAKAEAGELTVDAQVTLVDEVVRDALESVRAVAPEGVTLEDRCGNGADVRFLGDAIRARQVIGHLLTNACRFTRSGGRITVSCGPVEGPITPERLRGSGPWVRIDVEDTGIGIPGERLEAIFEPFVQADTNRYTRETDGTGLGLAISRYLARLMGGELTVRSEPGVGSRFSLWLPAPRPDGQGRSDRRTFDRGAEGLPLLADHLLQRLKPIVDTYVDRIRRDAGIPRGRNASDVALRNHIPHFISGIASLLAHSDGAGIEVSNVLRGGNAIQRMTLELHGGQRRRLGWSRDAVRRDLQLLRQTIELDIRRFAPDPGRLQDGLQVLARLFDQAERISLQGWQYADSDEAGGEREAGDSLDGGAR